MKKVTTPNSAEAWENGNFGRDVKYAKATDKKLGSQIDDVLGLQMISIRLEKDLIESYKLLGTKIWHGISTLDARSLKKIR